MEPDRRWRVRIYAFAVALNAAALVLTLADGDYLWSGAFTVVIAYLGYQLHAESAARS